MEQMHKGTDKLVISAIPDVLRDVPSTLVGFPTDHPFEPLT
jgi:hypothetical protein